MPSFFFFILVFVSFSNLFTFEQKRHLGALCVLMCTQRPASVVSLCVRLLIVSGFQVFDPCLIVAAWLFVSYFLCYIVLCLFSALILICQDLQGCFFFLFFTHGTGSHVLSHSLSRDVSSRATVPHWRINEHSGCWFFLASRKSGAPEGD